MSSRYAGSACCPGHCLWYLSNLSCRALPLSHGSTSAPEGRVSLPNTFCLHFPARIYSSASSHSSSKCALLLQNLHHSALVCMVLDSGLHGASLLGLARIASRPSLSLATFFASALSIAFTNSCWPGGMCSGTLGNACTGGGGSLTGSSVMAVGATGNITWRRRSKNGANC